MRVAGMWHVAFTVPGMVRVAFGRARKRDARKTINRDQSIETLDKGNHVHEKKMALEADAREELYAMHSVCAPSTSGY